MRTQITFKHVDPSYHEGIRRYLEKKLRRLSRLLVGYDDDAVLIRVTIQGPLEVHKRWEGRGVIHLPSGTLATEALNYKSPEAVIDELAEELWTKLRDHRQLLRKEHLHERKRRRQEKLATVAPLLAQDVARNRREEFFLLLTPLLDFLYRQARREIRLYELEGTLPRNEVSAGDVVDETVLVAWQEFEKRPEDLPLDAWLSGLLHRTLDRIVKRLAGEEVPAPQEVEEAGEKPIAVEEGEDLDEERWWLSHLAAPQDPIIWEDLFPDEEIPEPFEHLTREELEDRILHALASAPLADRIAFTLCVLDDYSAEDVARIQGRDPKEVEAAVERVRKFLRSKLQGEAA